MHKKLNGEKGRIGQGREEKSLNRGKEKEGFSTLTPFNMSSAEDGRFRKQGSGFYCLEILSQSFDFGI